jgi:hypothetical protein
MGLTSSEPVLRRDVENGTHVSGEGSTRRTCPSCGAAGQQQFCPECGQRRFEGRHTLRRFVRSLLSRVVAEEGVAQTAVQLTRRPGRVIRDFLAGKTIRYVNPVGYFLVSAAAFTLIGRVIGGSTGAAESDRILAILIIPFVAVASRVLQWRGRFNIAEHLILVTYLGSQVLVVLAVLYVGVLLVPSGAERTYALLALVSALSFYVWGYSQVFETRRLRAALVGVLSLLFGSALWLTILILILRLLRQ